MDGCSRPALHCQKIDNISVLFCYLGVQEGFIMKCRSVLHSSLLPRSVKKPLCKSPLELLRALLGLKNFVIPIYLNRLS